MRLLSLLAVGFTAVAIVSCSPGEKERIRRADALEGEGWEAAGRKEYSRAIDRLRRSLDENNSLDRKGRVAGIALGLAKLHLMLARSGEAASYAQQAIEAYSAIADRRGQIDAVKLLGDSWLLEGSVARAKNEYNNILTLAGLFRSSGGRDTISAHIDLGKSCLREGSWSEAVRHLAAAWNGAGRDSGAVMAGRWYADALFLSGDPLGADKVLRQSTKASIDAADTVNAVRTALSLVRSDLLRGNSVDGQADMEFVKRLIAAVPGDAMLQVDALLMEGEAAWNPALFDEAAGAARRGGSMFALAAITAIKADYAAARRWGQGDGLAPLSSADSIFRAYDFPLGQAVTWYERGRVLEQSGDKAAALEAYSRAAAIADSVPLPSLPILSLDPSLRARILRWPRIDWYDPIVRLSAQLRQADAALDAAEKRISRQLAARMRFVNFVFKDDSLTTLVKRALSLGARIEMLRGVDVDLLLASTGDEERQSALARELRASCQSFHSTVEEASGISPVFASLLKPSPLPAPEIRRRLAEGTTLVEYFDGSAGPLAFLVTRAQCIVVPAPGLNRLASLAADLPLPGDSVPSSDPKAGRRGTEVLQRIGRALLDPLARALGGAGTRRSSARGEMRAAAATRGEFVFVAPQASPGIPFPEAALARSLVRRVLSVRVVPSASSIAWERCAVDTTHAQTVAIGNPAGTDWDADYVLRDVRNWFREVNMNLSTSATWDTLRNMRGAVLFAVLPWTPAKSMDPSFFLSKGSESQPLDERGTGMLPQLNRFPTAVVTAVSGTWDPAEIATVLMAHGSRNVVVNLWKVNTRLMRSFDEIFFTGLASGTNAGEAFLNAVSSAAGEETKNPLAPGAYVLYGWGDN